jgi:hypothetical protein
MILAAIRSAFLSHQSSLLSAHHGANHGENAELICRGPFFEISRSAPCCGNGPTRHSG